MRTWLPAGRRLDGSLQQRRLRQLGESCGRRQWRRIVANGPRCTACRRRRGSSSRRIQFWCSRADGCETTPAAAVMATGSRPGPAAPTTQRPEARGLVTMKPPGRLIDIGGCRLHCVRRVRTAGRRSTPRSARRRSAGCSSSRASPVRTHLLVRPRGIRLGERTDAAHRGPHRRRTAGAAGARREPPPYLVVGHPATAS